jgi:hypothetical protein
MKTAIITLVLLNVINLHSQVDTAETLILPQLEIIRVIDNMIVANDFNRFDKNKFYLSYSHLTADKNYYNYNVYLKDIRKLSFRNGTHFWTGAGISAGAGFLIGFVAFGNGTNFSESTGPKPFDLGKGIFGGIICGIPTALIGGLIGLIFPKYDHYYFDMIEKNKKADYIKNLFMDYDLKD